MSKTSNLRPWAVWSTAALTALTISLSPIGTYAAHAATVEVKGTTGAVQTATTTPARNTSIPAIPDSSKQSALPNVLVIGTGGTIAGQSEDATSFQNYKAGTLPIGEMVDALPDKQKIADVSTLQFGNSGSG